VADAADVLVLHTAALGGVRRSLRVAERSGLPCVVVTGLETSIGLSAAAALAGALPEVPFACAIARPSWVSGDVVTPGRAMVATDGYLPVAPMPPAPEAALLAEYALTDPAALTRWHRRLRAVRDAL
jgi:O-succinylbenzoate synthase